MTEAASGFRARRAAVILARSFGRARGFPLPLVSQVTNPVTPTDRVFLRHFSMMIGFLVLVMFALIGLALYLYSFHPPPGNPMQKAETEARVAPVGAVYAGDTGRAAMAAAAEAAKTAAASQVAYGGTTDGKTIFGNLCTTCHTNAATGAPVITDKGAWAPRVAQGLDTLLKHAIEGYQGKDGKLMPAKGGNPALTDAQVKATVEWMVSQVK
jgi:cytochrome c5